jgi:hypothetical protein
MSSPWSAALEGLAEKRRLIGEAIMALAKVAGVDPAPYLGDGPVAVSGPPRDADLGTRARDLMDRVHKLKEPTPPRPQPPASPATTGTGLDDKVLHALRNGPLPPKAIRELTGIKMWTLPDVTARLVAAKRLKKIGNRRGLQYQLA